MAEPTSTTAAAGITALGILLLGPQLGPTLAPIIGDYLLILAGALIGVMHAAGKVRSATLTQAALYVIKWVGTAVLLTGALGVFIEQKAGIPATQWPGVMAFLITFLADRWPQWLRALAPRWLGLSDADARAAAEGDAGGGP